MTSTLFVLLMSFSTMQGYIDAAASKQGLGRSLTLVVASDYSPSAELSSRGWVNSHFLNHVFIREWALEAADDSYAHFFAAHEVCHLKLKHHAVLRTDSLPELADAIETDANRCVRLSVPSQEWNRMINGVRRMEKAYHKIEARRRRSKNMLSSP